MKKAVLVPPTISYDGIMDLLMDQNICSTADEFNKLYYHWENVYYHTDDNDLAIKIWTVMKFKRQMSCTHLDFCGMDLKYNIPPKFIELLNYIDHDSAGHTDIQLPGDRDGKRFLLSSMMEEAIASSQLEGASVTRKDAKNMLNTKKDPRNIDERMILNNYLAMIAVKEHLNVDLSPELIKFFHKTITNKTIKYGSDWEGKFRESNDVVVGDPLEMDIVYHVPPNYEKIPELISQLCEFANRDEPYVHPILKAIILHYLIGYIHPFVDGNGRLARSLFYWYAIKKGYWLLEYTTVSAIIKNSKTKYGKAYQYTESDDLDLTYFMDFNLDCIKKSIDSLYAYLKRKTAEQDEIIEIIGNDTDLSLMEITLLRKQIKRQDIFSIYDVKNEYNVSYQTARKHVNHLLDLGYLNKIGKNGKQDLFRITNKLPN